jgi:hypothetical protein
MRHNNWRKLVYKNAYPAGVHLCTIIYTELIGESSVILNYFLQNIFHLYLKHNLF